MARKFLRLYNGGVNGNMSSAHLNQNTSAQYLLTELGMSNIYSQEDVRNCANCFEQLATLIQTSQLQVIVQKFKSSKYYEVSRIVS
jgi:succinylglutamate desuccinylase